MHFYASNVVPITRSIMFNLKMINFHVQLISAAKVNKKIINQKQKNYPAY